ncbi:MAG: amino acid racemase [Eubacteriales bacterium]|nr:amino acid racemase [Eubacteriales bacterium]
MTVRGRSKQILGVIGGLGPLATASFYEQVVRMTDASADQDHLQVMIHSHPEIPDRTRYILDPDHAVSPVPALIEAGRMLAALGADRIAIPCITAHYFYDQLSTALPIPVIHLVGETVRYLRNQSFEKIGLLATDGTVSSRLFQSAADEAGLAIVLPDAVHQQDLMNIIYDQVKAERPVDRQKLTEISGALRQKGAQTIVLGCTELSVVQMRWTLGPGFHDAMGILARAAVIASGAALRDDHESLIVS